MATFVPNSFASVILFIVFFLIIRACTSLLCNSLASIPGPKLFALTKWRLAYEDYRGTRTRCVRSLHETYGSVVRTGPREISFNSLAALRTIYGAGTVFQRDTFYRMFDAYDRQVMFSFASSKEHRQRKKLLNNAYSKTSVLSWRNAAMVEGKVKQFMLLIDREADKGGSLEVFSALHYFSLDTITRFLYGEESRSDGATSALISTKDRMLLHDILHPDRRKLSWFTIHLPALSSWLYSRTGIVEAFIIWLDLLPMRKPTTYSGIRSHALKAAEQIHQAGSSGSTSLDANQSIAERLLLAISPNNVKSVGRIDPIDVAAECADHLLAGIDTTSDTLMWSIFALSQPENHEFQEKLRAEMQFIAIDQDDKTISALAADKLPYLDAVIKETLRLFAPLPGTEPRVAETDQVIDGYQIPKGTVVSISPYTLHRNPEIFKDPERFNPHRWIDGSVEEVAEMKRWFWAFSSGGRMCIGMHLAMAEMTTLLANVYRKYKTEISPGFGGVSPGVTARYEVFSDEQFVRMKEHVCWIRFDQA